MKISPENEAQLTSHAAEILVINICTHTCQSGSPIFALFLYSHFRKRVCHIRGLASISVQRCQDGHG